MLVRYALSKYSDEYDKVLPNCPYDTRMGGHKAFIQEVSWFVYEWKNPDTGLTILDEFVEQKVRDKNQAFKILRRKNIIYDEFEVIRNSTPHMQEQRQIMTVRAKKTNKEYDVILPKSQTEYPKGSFVIGRIHKHANDKVFSVCGVLTVPGEWDVEDSIPDDAHIITKSGTIITKEKARAELEKNFSGSRAGPGLVPGQIEDIMKIMYAPLNDDLSELSMNSDDRNKFMKRMQKEKDTINTALSTPINVNADLKSILKGYSKYHLEMICNENDIPSLLTRDAMIERLTDKLPQTICRSLSRMSIGEQEGLVYILRRGPLSFFNPDSELLYKLLTGNKSPEDVSIESFFQVYIQIGVLVAGKQKIDGHKQQQSIVTVASDIRKIMLSCPGWNEYVKTGKRSNTVKYTVYDA